MTNKVRFEPSKLIFDKNCGEGKLKLLKVLASMLPFATLTSAELERLGMSALKGLVVVFGGAVHSGGVEVAELVFGDCCTHFTAKVQQEV